jgi:tRNA(Arg) A34 adenosine deaminase TadA
MKEKNRAGEYYMLLAIKEAEKNLREMRGGPFGACIVKGGRVLAVARNSVLKQDATCHAEINAIRLASRKIKNFDLSGCVIYSTTEPCPMCFSAIHWARIDRVFYGTTIADAKRIGFNELSVSASRLKQLGKSRVRVTANFLREECRRLFDAWERLENKRFY